MTKHRLFITIIIGTCIVAYFLLKGNRALRDSSPNTPSSSAPVKESHQIDTEKLSIDGKKVIGLPAGKEKEEIKQLQIVNAPSPEWKENLISNLKHQGGEMIKDIKIKKIDSFVWNQDGKGIFVESAIVTLVNQKNEQSSFSVMVDAQSGKILQNWGHPVVDPANPRESFRIMLDPRYHQD